MESLFCFIVTGKHILKMTNRHIYFPAIDGLRFLAFLLVFFFHFNGFIVSNFLNKIGWTGVELFFLLSGFLLTKLLAVEQKLENTIQLYKYFIRRVLRIWPLYFLYLLITIILSLWIIKTSLSFPRLFGNIFFYDNIAIITNGFNHNLGSIHLWSLALEEQYYLVLPFAIPWLVKLNRRRMNLFVLFTFLILVVSRYLLVREEFGYSLIYVLPFSGDSFLAGIILGIGNYDIFLKKINSTVAFLVGVGLLGLLFLLPDRTVMNYNQLLIYFIPALAFSFIFISVVYAQKGWPYKLFSNKIIRYLGKISFGLYLFHVLANRFTHYIFYKFNKPVNEWGFIISLTITILLAILSYELFEKHFLKIKKKFTVIKNRDI